MKGAVGGGSAVRGRRGHCGSLCFCLGVRDVGYSREDVVETKCGIKCRWRHKYVLKRVMQCVRSRFGHLVQLCFKWCNRQKFIHCSAKSYPYAF